jgi:hypothetical protein
VGEVPVVVGTVPVVLVDDLGDRGAGGGFVDEVLGGGERGDQALPTRRETCSRWCRCCDPRRGRSRRCNVTTNSRPIPNWL